MNKNSDFDPEDMKWIFEEVPKAVEQAKIKQKKEFKKALIKGDTTIHKFIIPALILFALIILIRFIK